MAKEATVDIYSLATDFLLDMPLISSWPDMQAILERRASHKPHDWQLPVVGCEAVGGSRGQAIPGVAAIACLQTSIILIDDMLDTDPRGEHHRIGMPAAANLAVAFQAAGLVAIARGNSPEDVRLAALRSLSHMALTTAVGQHWDVQNPADEKAYWRLVCTKSSPFFGAALYVGALLGGASTQTAVQLEQFGHIYGEMIQIHDDLNDAMATPANPDWIQGRSPLPVLYAQVVAHPERERFLALRQSIADPDALSEAQKILIRCGAVSYCVDQLLRRYQELQELLNAISLTDTAGLETLLDLVVKPVESMLATVGVTEDMGRIIDL